MAACDYLKSVISELWPQQSAGVPVWAVLDAASEERIVGEIEKAGLESCCLFPGRVDAELRAAAPHLVKLRLGHAFTEYVVSEGWDRHWGVFLQAGVPMEELRLHLRKFLRVMDEERQRLFFRFYDPRVLRVYLPTCTQHELRVFYGPVVRFVMEDEEPGNLVEFALHDRDLKIRRVPLPVAIRSKSAASS